MFSGTKFKFDVMEEIVKAAELEARLKVTRKTLHTWSENGQMPKKIRLVKGGRATGWLKSEIDEWLEERLASRDLEGDKK